MTGGILNLDPNLNPHCKGCDCLYPVETSISEHYCDDCYKKKITSEWGKSRRRRRDELAAKTYDDYLEIKRMVTEEEATTNFVMERLNVSLFVARCLVKDWMGTEEEADINEG